MMDQGIFVNTESMHVCVAFYISLQEWGVKLPYVIILPNSVKKFPNYEKMKALIEASAYPVKCIFGYLISSYFIIRNTDLELIGSGHFVFGTECFSPKSNLTPQMKQVRFETCCKDWAIPGYETRLVKEKERNEERKKIKEKCCCKKLGWQKMQ